MDIRNLYHPLLILVSITIVLCTCSEEIQLSHPNKERNIVIEGEISTELKQHKVVISYDNESLTQGQTTPFTGLKVWISSNTERIELNEKSPGIYYTDSIAGKPGEWYTLYVDEGERLFIAQDQMPMLPSLFSPTQFTEQRESLEFEFRRHQFGFEVPNYWTLQIIQDPLPDFYQRIDPDQLGKEIGVEVSNDYEYTFSYYTHPRIEVNGLLDFKTPHYFGFQPGFKVVHKKYNLSEAYYKFLISLFRETEWRGTLFPSTPANVEGNVNNGGLGFFRAVSTIQRTYQP